MQRWCLPASFPRGPSVGNVLRLPTTASLRLHRPLRRSASWPPPRTARLAREWRRCTAPHRTAQQHPNSAVSTNDEKGVARFMNSCSSSLQRAVVRYGGRRCMIDDADDADDAAADDGCGLKPRLIKAAGLPAWHTTWCTTSGQDVCSR